MKWISLLILLASHGASADEAFRLELHDRKLVVRSPVKVGPQFSVIVENQSVSAVLGKFSSGEEDLRFVRVAPASSQTVEFAVKSGAKVFFRPLAPAFQEVELVAGKKTYEIPPQ